MNNSIDKVPSRTSGDEEPPLFTGRHDDIPHAIVSLINERVKFLMVHIERTRMGKENGRLANEMANEFQRLIGEMEKFRNSSEMRMIKDQQIVINDLLDRVAALERGTVYDGDYSQNIDQRALSNRKALAKDA